MSIRLLAVTAFLFAFSTSDPAWSQETHELTEKSRPASESVATTARCEEGTVVNARIKASAADVEIVEQSGVDCDSEGCHAWMVTARRTSGEPFDIEIRLVCSGDGEDTVFDRARKRQLEQKGESDGEQQDGGQ